jgi:predicted nucleotidyltransferase
MPATVETKEEILRRLLDEGRQIRSLGVRRLGLFGSFVRGEQGPGSDVDVLVEFEPGRKSFDSFMTLAFLLEEMLQRRVELVTPESLSPYLRPKILPEVQDVPLGA